MDQASPVPTTNARKLTHEIMRRVASVKNHEISVAIGKDESTVSRIISGEAGLKLDTIHPFLAVLGLKVVPWGHVCVDSAEWDATQTLARKYMEQEKTATPQVDWNT